MDKFFKEYIVYPCCGKKYNDEKGVISLTSWKKRISTVPKTLFSLLSNRPGFHIVLVLSEKEFPRREKELPEELMLFVNGGLVEILWVFENYRAFKKVIFTLNKYRTVPVISADDCVYTCNYADILYNKWLKNKNCVITMGNVGRFKIENKYFDRTVGPATLYNYTLCGNAITAINDKILSTNNDDSFWGIFLKRENIKIIGLNKNFSEYLYFHDEIEPMTFSMSNRSEKYLRDKKLIYKELYANENR